MDGGFGFWVKPAVCYSYSAGFDYH